MHPLAPLRAVFGAPTRWRLRRHADRFDALTIDCRATQRDVLARLLALNADSAFSAEHKLGEIRDPDGLRDRLPIADFETFRPWIERLKQGDHSALLGANNPLLMFTLSSGTTDDSKFIPITRPFLEAYRQGWQTWGIRAVDAHPGAKLKNIVQLSSNHNRFQTAGGTPCGNISGLVQAMQHPIVRSMYTVPGCIAQIEDPEAKSYAILRLMLADPHIGMVMTANPSTLIQLARRGDAWKTSLIRDIAEGGISAEFDVPPTIREQLGRRLGKSPSRARQLESIAEKAGRLLPRDYLPDLDLIAVWLGGSCQAYLPTLRELFGDRPIRDHGLSASEGRMTIPFADNDSAGVLDVGTHFFEFIPEEEYESGTPTVLAAHELEQDRNYFILLTTSSGLYRYDIRDVVRCVGFQNTTPRLQFLHKGAHVASLTGEKLTESQVVAAVRMVMERHGVRCDHFTLFPHWDDPPGYRMALEDGDLRNIEAPERFVAEIDVALQASNCEFQEKRKTGRLAPLAILPVRRDTWHDFAIQRRNKKGGSAEQYKHPCLLPTLEAGADFRQQFAAPMDA